MFQLSDINHFIIQYLTAVLMILKFLHENTPFKWEQGTLVVILDDVYICTFIGVLFLFPYTFIGWVWEISAAHLYQVYAGDNLRGYTI